MHAQKNRRSMRVQIKIAAPFKLLSYISNNKINAWIYSFFCCSIKKKICGGHTIHRYAQYSHFKIYSEADYYKLEIDGYEGNAGDSLNDPWYGSNNSPFSTYNRDNDRSSLNCASMLKVSVFNKCRVIIFSLVALIVKSKRRNDKKKIYSKI